MNPRNISNDESMFTLINTISILSSSLQVNVLLVDNCATKSPLKAQLQKLELIVEL